MSERQLVEFPLDQETATNTPSLIETVAMAITASSTHDSEHLARAALQAIEASGTHLVVERRLADEPITAGATTLIPYSSETTDETGNEVEKIMTGKILVWVDSPDDVEHPLTISTGDYISTVIARLQLLSNELNNKGYRDAMIVTDGNVKLSWRALRMETDDEYAARMKKQGNIKEAVRVFSENEKKKRYEEYLRLKAEFESLAKL